jgi:DNA-directed RNA polymerase subunit RPC12/RpoP
MATTDPTPRNDGNDMKCSWCGKPFWLHPLAVLLACPHCGKPMTVMKPRATGR